MSPKPRTQKLLNEKLISRKFPKKFEGNLQPVLPKNLLHFLRE